MLYSLPQDMSVLFPDRIPWGKVCLHKRVPILTIHLVRLRGFIRTLQVQLGLPGKKQRFFRVSHDL